MSHCLAVVNQGPARLVPVSSVGGYPMRSAAPSTSSALKSAADVVGFVCAWGWRHAGARQVCLFLCDDPAVQRLATTP